MNMLLPLILAAVVTMLLIPLLERRAAGLHMMDKPESRKVHVAPVPRVGGIAMAVGITGSMLLWGPLDRSVAAVMLGALVIFGFGIWDDHSELSPSTKLLGQLIGVGMAVFGGDVSIHSITLTGRIELPPLVSVPLTILFLVGVTNAVNLADGLDGLAGGVVLFCCAAIAALGIGSGLSGLLVAVFAVMGSLLGFLRYNSYPATVFMGDGGSQLLGYLMGIFAVSLTQAAHLPFSAALPLLLLGIPIIDTLTVMLMRIGAGRSPLSADRNHLHHRLLALGLDHFEAVALIYVLQGMLFVLAWTMRFQSDIAILLVFVACATLVMGSLLVAERAGWRWQGAGWRRLGDIVEERLPWLKAPARLPRWGNATAWLLVTTYLVMVGATTSSVSPDIAWLALALAALLCAALLRLLPWKVIGGPAHAAVFVAMATAVYLDHVQPVDAEVFSRTKWLVFPVLTVAVLARFRFWRERRFEITTLDVLVVFLALTLPNLPGLQRAPGDVGLSVAKLVVLMYAAEILTRSTDRTRAWLWTSAALALFLIGMRGLRLWPG